MNIKKKAVGFKKNIKKHALTFHYNITSDPFLDIGYVPVRRIPCSCFACLSKMNPPQKISQDKYNQDRYKGANKNCVYWNFIEPYNNKKIIHSIDSIKQHK